MHIPRFFLTSADLAPAGTAGAEEKLRTRERTADKNIHVPPLDLEPGEVISIVSPVVANQIRNVLRLKAGDKIIVLDGAGALYRCTIVTSDSKLSNCRVDQREKATGEPSLNIVVALPPLKGERFEWALQKLTELGASTIVPLITARTIVRLEAPSGTKENSSLDNKLSRWRSIVKEAAEQCERAMIPHIVPPKKIQEFINELTGGGTGCTAFICAERLSTTPLRDILSDRFCNNENFSATTDTTITLVIGPEGGFTEEEITFAVERGVEPVSLGARILRAETAAIYALAQVVSSIEN